MNLIYLFNFIRDQFEKKALRLMPLFLYFRVEVLKKEDAAWQYIISK